MFLNLEVKATRFFLASTVLLLAISPAGQSQDISDEAIDTLDEIIVYGEPTLRLLRNEVWEAEENFYELFNSLNKGRQFDVTCYQRKPIGSHIARRTCEAYFVKTPLYGVSYSAYVRHKTKQMRQEMVALVDKHSALSAALVNFVDAKQSFDFSLHNRCGNRPSICRK